MPLVTTMYVTKQEKHECHKDIKYIHNLYNDRMAYKNLIFISSQSSHFITYSITKHLTIEISSHVIHQYLHVHIISLLFYPSFDFYLLIYLSRVQYLKLSCMVIQLMMCVHWWNDCSGTKSLLLKVDWIAFYR